MRYFFFIALLLLSINTIQAQVLTNTGASFTIKTGGTVTVNGAALLQPGGILINDGSLSVSGNITNNQSMASANAGTLNLNGSSAQSLNGSATYFAKNVVVNNAAGVALNTALKADGIVTFTTGNITNIAAANALIVTTNGSVTGASDNSHVNGYIIKEGTGNFTYPVGDATRYQKIDVNLTANSSGMSVKYNAADAGSAPFTTGGTEAVPLVSYNTQEYWDIMPVSSCTGTVTVYWDGYKDSYSTPPVNQRRVAHKSGGSWLNEGSALTATGTTAAGSVTSNPITAWSPFALGSVINVLPVKWTNILGRLDANKNPVISWRVEEQNANQYSIEKSITGNNFSSIGNQQSVGNGIHDYIFTESLPLKGTAFYRVKQTDFDDRSSFSETVKLSTNDAEIITVYPNPAVDFIRIEIPRLLIDTQVSILDARGRTIKRFVISTTSYRLSVNGLPKSTYYLQFSDGSKVPFVKM